MNHTNADISGAAGFVPNTGFSGVCGGETGSVNPLPQFKAVAGAIVNVTFPYLPKDVSPPFGIGQCFVHDGKGFGKNTAVDLGGGTTLNSTSFIWHVDGVVFNASGDSTTVGVPGDSVIWTIVPQSFNASAAPEDDNKQIPYWASGNYTITYANGSVPTQSGAAEPRIPGSHVKSIAGLAATALWLGACLL